MHITNLKKLALIASPLVVLLLITVMFIVMGDSTEETSEKQVTNDVYQDWVRVCAKDNANQCEVVQQLTKQETGQLVAKMAVVKLKEGAALGTVITPLGISLQQTPMLVLNETTNIPLQMKTCMLSGCMGMLQLTPELMDGLKQGESLKLKLANESGAPIVFDLSLKGFDQAYDGLPERS